MSGRVLNRVITDKLLIYIDGANSNCYDSGTTLYNLVNNDPGSLINGVTYDSNNRGSFVFDGVNDYIDLGSRVTSLAPSYPLSIDCWIWVSSTNPANGGVFTSANGLTVPYYGFSLQIFSNLIFANIGDGTGGGSINRRSFLTTNTLVPEVWNHVVVTVDTGNIFQVYLNGLLMSGSYSGSGGSINWGSGTTTQIGLSTAYNTPFKGKISNVKLYNKLLSQDEVLQNYNALKNRFI
jgi:hypothetical protein